MNANARKWDAKTSDAHRPWGRSNLSRLTDSQSFFIRVHSRAFPAPSFIRRLPPAARFLFNPARPDLQNLIECPSIGGDAFDGEMDFIGHRVAFDDFVGVEMQPTIANLELLAD